MIFNPLVFENTAWKQHLPFAYDLIREAKPQLLVELGTHNGGSYFGFCQAVKDQGLPTVCYAIDTWEGDIQTQFYGIEVFNKVNEINSSHFESFSYLTKSLFDTAAQNFSNESIDILHIDGLHTYEAVTNDFATWKDKVKPTGIILFHDIMVRSEGFGVWKLWEQLQDSYATFSFRFGYGLGVLFMSELAYKGNKFLEYLFAGDEATKQIHESYQKEYRIMYNTFEIRKFQDQLRTQSATIELLENNLRISEERLQDAQEKILLYSRRYKWINKIYKASSLFLKSAK